MSLGLAYEAMTFARKVHEAQRRKYTGNHYADHLAEVAGIVSTVTEGMTPHQREVAIAVAWLHDCVEDQAIPADMIEELFGAEVRDGVLWLSDLEIGNRATRKLLSRQRLAAAPAWVQTIKVADLISNTSSIVEHDPDFAIVYLKEKRRLLDVLDKADARLVTLARSQCER